MHLLEGPDKGNTFRNYEVKLEINQPPGEICTRDIQIIRHKTLCHNLRPLPKLGMFARNAQGALCVALDHIRHVCQSDTLRSERATRQ